MKSLNNFQVQPDYLLNMLAANNTNRTPQFIDLFDASKLDTSLLRKRDFQSQDNLFQQELQKKIKTSMEFPRASPLQLPTFNPMLYTNRNFPVNPLMNPLGQDQSFGSLADQLKQLQSLTLLQQQQNALQSLQTLSFPANKPLIKAKMNLKEEYVKQEELPTTQGSPSLYPFKSTLSDNHTVSENSPVSSELQMAEPVGEPALVYFTREFPEWDLATIFNYLKSGKSRDVFEKEKQFKMERKIRRQKIKQANKEKALALKLKKAKGKVNKTEETEPAQE